MTGFQTLQGLILPDQSLCPVLEPALYLRADDGVTQPDGAPGLRFSAGAQVGFDTYFNLFNLGKWQQHCALKDLYLTLEGDGVFDLDIIVAEPGATPAAEAPPAAPSEQISRHRISLSADEPHHIELSERLDGSQKALLYIRLQAQGAARLDALRWQTRTAPQRQPDLALVITTFQRQADVQRAVARFEQFMTCSPLRDYMHLMVIDNGQNSGVAATKHVTPIDNANLGGSGGFARAMIEARARGASHCLFMDDDAAAHMASHERSWMFLAYACDPATALAGAMLQTHDPWSLWENGALFDRFCHPQYMGTDLRDLAELSALEFATTAPLPANFYGGWWYFAFALEHAPHLPFPFFVRGDDVSFCLAHDFNIVTLPGVASYQDTFPEKETPLTWYLDLRSHMAHHLSLPDMEIGRWSLLGVAIWFHLRNIIRCHYDTLAALNLAFADVLAGPDYFADHPDIAARRTDIAALSTTERWHPVHDDATADLIRLNTKTRALPRLIMKLTLNGHLLPFFGRFGNHITLTARNRGQVRAIWGAARIDCRTGDGAHSYTVTHSKRRMLRQSWGLLRNAARFLWRYQSLKDDWQGRYDPLTSESYWRPALGLGPDPTKTPAKDVCPRQ